MRSLGEVLANAVLVITGVGFIILGMFWLRDIHRLQNKHQIHYDWQSRESDEVVLTLRGYAVWAMSLIMLGIGIFILDLWLLANFHGTLFKIIGPLI